MIAIKGYHIIWVKEHHYMDVTTVDETKDT